MKGGKQETSLAFILFQKLLPISTPTIVIALLLNLKADAHFSIHGG